MRDNIDLGKRRILEDESEILIDSDLTNLGAY